MNDKKLRDGLFSRWGSETGQQRLSLFSGPSKIRQNPLLMDCLPKEGRHFQFTAIKLSPSYPPAWDFLGVREICAECWRREFQGKFSFVLSPHTGAIRKHFLHNGIEEKDWNGGGKWLPKMEQTASDGRSVVQGYVSSCARDMVIVAEICNFLLLPANLGILPFD